MKFRYLLAATVAFASLSAPVLAGDDDKGEQKQKEQKICKKERSTGSLTRVTKICLTREEWRELNSKTKDQIDGYSRRMGNREGAGQAG